MKPVKCESDSHAEGSVFQDCMPTGVQFIKVDKLKLTDNTDFVGHEKQLQVCNGFFFEISINFDFLNLILYLY